MTPREAIRQATRQLEATGVPDAAHDAAALLSHVTGRAPMPLRLDMDTALDSEALAAYAALVEKRQRRVPLQHLVGGVFFCGHWFHADERALIPRPETELLPRRCVEYLRGKAHPAVLDLCCGTGCIGVSVALALPAAQVTLSDISAEALALAAENAAQLNAPVRLCQGDLFAAVAGQLFDCILSNPPYIPTEDCATLQPEVLHDPLLALDGGADGLAFYRRIAAEAPAHLADSGLLLLECGDGEGAQVCALLAEAGFQAIELTNDINGLPRMAEAVWRPDEREV